MMDCLIGMAKIDLKVALQPSQPVSEERVCAVALYVQQAQTRTLWVVLDMMDFNRHVVDTLKHAVSARIGLSESHVHILTTHNHGGGEPNPDALAPLIADCAWEAMQTAAPAKIRFAITQVPKQVTLIRRMYVPEIESATTVFFGITEQTGFDSAPHTEFVIQKLKEGTYPYVGTIDTDRPFTPYPPGDPQIVAVEFQTLDGNPIGSLVRFATHVVCSNRAGIFTGDFPHHLRQKMEATLGGTAMYLSGPCANICPGMERKNDGTSQILGTLLADTALGALKKATFSPLKAVKEAAVSIDLPVRKEVLEAAVEIPDQIPEDLPSRRVYLEQQGVLSRMDFLREKYAEGESALRTATEVSVGLLKLNDLVFAAFPGETFYETGEAVRAAFPESTLVTVTEHGRTVMYLPPYDQLAQGGYETVCRLTDEGAAEKLEKETISAVKQFLNL